MDWGSVFCPPPFTCTLLVLCGSSTSHVKGVTRESKLAFLATRSQGPCLQFTLHPFSHEIRLKMC